MHVRFLVGPAGSGKTVRCLTEARQALIAAPEGGPLVLLAPKQGTYQLEQQILSDPSLPGYTRLQIVSFESLARLILDSLQKPPPQMLDEEGRLMVLRNLLTTQRQKLKIFHASARLTGFAQQLSLILRDLQRNCLGPAALNELAARVQHLEGLGYRLQDLATLLAEYLGWLADHKLQDADGLLIAAAEALRANRKSRPPCSNLVRAAEGMRSETTEVVPLRLERLWIDGFAEFPEHELNLLVELIPECEQATFTFCLPHLEHSPNTSWLSPWSLVNKSFDRCLKRVKGVPAAKIVVQKMPSEKNATRFAKSPLLQHLEQHWGEAAPFASSKQFQLGLGTRENRVRIVACPNPEAEARFAAREILKFVRAGARFRDISVLVRNLDDYHQPLQRMFSRYNIPFFLDHRESVAHHPLAELTRSALRTVAFDWRHEDWFAALKSGLVADDESDIDRLENEALARGWQGSIWRQPLRFRPDSTIAAAIEKTQLIERQMEELRRQIIWPFEQFALALTVHGNQLTGPMLATAIRQLWGSLDAQRQLETWVAAEPCSYESLARGSTHLTVWKQCQTWLDNLELAFATDSLPLRRWLPILEAGLAGLTIGSIPPALDQVLIGAIDRSRTPDIKLALVLGMNESVFPAPPRGSVLLSDADRQELEKYNLHLGSSSRRQLGFEHYLAYIACTRARERLVLTCALNDANGKPLNPSSFLARVARLLPGLQLEQPAPGFDWRQSEHAHELIGPLLSSRVELAQIPQLESLRRELNQNHLPPLDESLAPDLVEKLYGPVLQTSVSGMEQFAACPFKFFVRAGLHAQERKVYELDLREQGTFQHDVLALFHRQLQTEGKRWRDLTPRQARERVGEIARNLVDDFRDGLLRVSEETRFTATVLIESLQDFIETLTGWMQQQYLFDPVAVELPFGQDDGSPAWSIDLQDSHRLEIRGRIDRVDLYRAPGSGQALCVVIDYKSSQKELDPMLMAHGIQLQLLTYLNVLRHWPNPLALFGAERLRPTGAFYVSLRGRYPRESNRVEALAQTEQARRSAYRHSGRFDSRALLQLDARAGQHQPDQFHYRLKSDGGIHRGCREALDSAQFMALLDQVERRLKDMGRQIYSGAAAVDPYRKGALIACEQCDYSAICRLDPWTHRFRVLKRENPIQGGT